MSRSKTILFACFLLSATILQAQTKKVSGKIKQDNGTAVADVAVTLRTISDSTLVKGVVTDKQGSFVLENLDTGTYLLNVSHVSFKPCWQKVVIANMDVTLKDVLLAKIAATVLKEVMVKSQKPLFTRSIDKLTLNVEGTVYEKGENGLRLFNVIPGVQVTGRDIQFRGSEGVTVYVDNRRIILPGDQLFAYLSSIPSESIKSYELKAVPGAENDAQNGGVIINIVLKSEYKYGLSGNVNSGYWYNGDNNVKGSTLVNYRVGKLTMQGSFNYWRSPASYEDHITQEFKSTGVYSQQTEKYREDYHSVSYNVGIDYKLTDKQTIGANYNMFTNPGDISNTTTTDINFLANAHANSIDSSLYTNSGSKFRYINQMANVFYRNKLDSLGSKLDVGYSYIYYDLNDPRFIETKFLNSAWAP